MQGQREPKGGHWSAKGKGGQRETSRAGPETAFTEHEQAFRQPEQAFKFSEQAFRKNKARARGLRAQGLMRVGTWAWPGEARLWGPGPSAREA